MVQLGITYLSVYPVVSQFVEKLLEDLYADDVRSGTKTIEKGK